MAERFGEIDTTEVAEMEAELFGFVSGSAAAAAPPPLGRLASVNATADEEAEASWLMGEGGLPSAGAAPPLVRMDSSANTDGVTEEEAMAWLGALTPRRATMAAGQQRPKFTQAAKDEAAVEAAQAAANAAEAAEEAEEEWKEATDLFLSPTGGALPAKVVGTPGGNDAARMPRLSFFLRTPDVSGADRANGADRRISYAFKAQKDQDDVEAWLKSNSPLAPRRMTQAPPALGAINEVAAPDVTTPAGQATAEAPQLAAAPSTRSIHGLKQPQPLRSLGLPNKKATAAAATTRTSSLKKPSGHPTAPPAKTQLPAPPVRASKRLTRK